MPGSFSRSDSPHPFRLQRPPPPRARRPKTTTTDEEATQEEPSITPNPPLQTRYIDMLLQLDTIPKLHNILAGAFSWLLLAGYLVLPGTFTSIRNSRTLSEGAGKAGKVVVKTAQNLPLLWLAGFGCGIASVGILFLCRIWYSNYKWMLDRIIWPSLTNSAIGFLTTIINIYTARGGHWSVTAIVTAAVTGGYTTIMLVLLLVFDIWGMRKIMKEHDDEKERAEQEEARRVSRGRGEV
ncbi:hypothetical protein BKA61DRAFT_741426 [Leptodontidium sp. MPI-SDFR-AT-0119]|nr:hypothetical protein BKA61DRAFT_741426 [Leptodontidium sp. MPI-SDFR-AT-0119]